MSVQITEQDFYDMRAQRDNERTKNLALQIELARLTAANESMQEDAVQNTFAINALKASDKLATEQITALKQALTDIRTTTVTLGDSQSAWMAWRKCCEIAEKALEEK